MNTPRTQNVCTTGTNGREETGMQEVTDCRNRKILLTKKSHEHFAIFPSLFFEKFLLTLPSPLFLSVAFPEVAGPAGLKAGTGETLGLKEVSSRGGH